MVLTMEQLTENVRVFVEYWAGEKLLSRRDGNSLRVVTILSNGK